MNIEARGLEGQIRFDGHNVTITRRGFVPFLTHGAGGTKSIPLRSITAVQHRRCGLFHGYLQLSVQGELDFGAQRGKDESLSKDENAVVFYFVANAAFQSFADQLRAAISNIANGQASGQPTGPSPQAYAFESPRSAPATEFMTGPVTSQSVFAQIEELGRLQKSGLLELTEFETKKREMLDRL